MNVTVMLVPASRVPRRATAVIIDVLRASTTLVQARLRGARRVIAAASPEEARAIQRRQPGALLCGEREGRMLPGFDLGNSPLEYGFETVAGRDLIFASTNGSTALLAARAARKRVLGAFVNAAASCEALAAETEVVLVCAGTLGRFALEDAACAGLLCRRLVARGATIAGPAARLAMALAPEGAEEVRSLVHGSDHARYLRGLGASFAEDVEFCAGLDRIDRAFEV